jgi:hypothetical protein
MLAAVPYLLLSASQSVKLRTVVNWDGSGLRQYTVSCLADRSLDARKRLRERTQRFDREHVQRAGPDRIITRDWRPANLTAAVPDSSLQMSGIIQKPLSIWTYYEWSEKLEIYRDTATDVETYGDEIASFVYRLEMPGRVTTSAPGGDIRGGTVSWELSAEQPEHTLTAASRRVRWEYLLFVVYVLGFAVFHATRAAVGFVRNRPRKI